MKNNNKALKGLGCIIAMNFAIMVPKSVLAESIEKEIKKEAAPYEVYVISHGEKRPRSIENPEYDTREYKDQLAKKDNRRVDVSGIFKQELPDGTKLWLSEDPVNVNKELAGAFNGSLHLENGSVKNNLVLDLYTNYSDFIEKVSVEVYHDEELRNKLFTKDWNSDSLGVLTSLEISNDELQEISLSESKESLYYVLSVYDKDGNVDKQQPQRLMVENDDLEENGASTVENSSSRLYGQNFLAEENIIAKGSSIRIYGDDVSRDYKLHINDNYIPIDTENKFAIEFIKKPGFHEFDIKLDDGSGIIWDRKLSKKVEENYMFLVGLADLTVSENNISGNMETLGDSDRYDEGLLTEGRLAFYLKGKIQGKYLITAQMDTTETELDHLFSNFNGRDAQTLFRKIDPERYYPVYGDDSESWSDANSQGKLYVRLDWDASRAVFGNYNSNIEDKRYGTYNRTLYGAQIDYKTVKNTKYNDKEGRLNVFVSDPNTVPSYVEFLGTGGSVYMLRDSDIVMGSETLSLEIRDKETNRVLYKKSLEEGKDYDINYVQGRIILNRPLSMYTNEEDNRIIREDSLGNNEVYLTANYEYVPSGNFDPDEIITGANGEYWLSDNLAVGGTYVKENQDSGSDYELKGINTKIKYSEETQIAAEYAETNSSGFRGFQSRDGGVTFDSISVLSSTSQRSSASSIEGSINVGDIVPSQDDLKVNFWLSEIEKGFQNTSKEFSEDQSNVEVNITKELGSDSDLSVAYKYHDEENVMKRERVSGIYAKSISNDETVSVELANETEETSAGKGRADLAGVKYNKEIKESSNVYAFGQATFNAKNSYSNNDRVGIGANYEITDKLDVNGEVSTGARGEGYTLGAAYDMTDNYSVYGGYTYDDSDGQVEDSIIAGQKYRYSQSLDIYQETKFTQGDTSPGLLNTFGLDYSLENDWKFGGFIERGDYDSSTNGETRRNSVSTYAKYDGERLDYKGVVEYRRDKGGDEIISRITTHQVDYDLNNEYDIYGLFDYADTEDLKTASNSIYYNEYALGVAYRPVYNDKLNVFSKYRYVKDNPGAGQDNDLPSHKSNIISVEGVYDLNKYWSLSAKAAYRESEIQISGFNDWFDSSACLISTRADYHLVKDWDVYVEGRRLAVDSEDNRDGFLIGANKHIGKHLKVGAGYNFTDFSDDLARVNDYTYEGVFINITGKY